MRHGPGIAAFKGRVWARRGQVICCCQQSVERVREGEETRGTQVTELFTGGCAATLLSGDSPGAPCQHDQSLLGNIPRASAVRGWGGPVSTSLVCPPQNPPRRRWVLWDPKSKWHQVLLTEPCLGQHLGTRGSPSWCWGTRRLPRCPRLCRRAGVRWCSAQLGVPRVKAVGTCRRRGDLCPAAPAPYLRGTCLKHS